MSEGFESWKKIANFTMKANSISDNFSYFEHIQIYDRQNGKTFQT
jgi:hypothetical protein